MAQERHAAAMRLLFVADRSVGQTRLATGASIMSHRWILAVLASLACVGHRPTRSEDAAAGPTAADRDAEALVAKRPESIDEWESRRPALVRWLQTRLGERPDKSPEWSLSGDPLKRDHCSCYSLNHGDAGRGRLFVPAQHVGRGPAVVYFAGGAMPATIADRNRERADWTWDACEDLARAGYVTLLVYESGVVRPGEAQGTKRTPGPSWQATTQADLAGVEFLINRREVDPERVAVLGVEATARRAWWVAALDQRLAAVASLGTPELSTLEDRVLTCLVAPRPHRLALDIKGVRDRQAAYDRWLAAPQEIYERYELSSILSTRVGAGFGSSVTSPAWHDTLRWLN